MAKPIISAIVPAYNEEKTVEKVITTLKASNYINEIICINDGSTRQYRKAPREI